jgi:ectoine hydroxylase-related dioxygenase (phytanoyl-CoA dioxygenase family)
MNYTTVEQAKTILDTDFLDENGYVIVQGVISPEEIYNAKQRINEIQKIESPRNGEFGYSLLRERLLKDNKVFKLYLFDLVFRSLRLLFTLLLKVLPQLKQFIKTNENKKSGSTKAELRQMLICIREQLDHPRDKRVCDLVNKGIEFDIFYQNPKILAFVEHIIGEDFKLSSLNLRSPQKNSKKQDMHVDYPWAIKGDKFYACNALFLLDDMSEFNGSTRVVPGSHKSGMMPYEAMPDQKAEHPNEIILNAKAGDVIFLNSHVWHGGTINKSGKERTIVQSYFVHRSHPPQQFQRSQIREETERRLNKRALEILDIHRNN